VLYGLLSGTVGFPLLGWILNSVYYGLIVTAIATTAALFYNTMTRAGSDPFRLRVFVFASAVMALPLGVISSRIANIFYFPPDQWGFSLIMKQLAAGPLETFHAALILPLGFIAVIAVILKLRLSLVTDTLFLYLPVGHAIGRTGCLLVGCCWGHPVTLSVFGTTYTFDNPVPLYEIGLNLFLFIFLRFQYHRIYGSGSHSPTGRGRITAFYLIGYGVLRMGLELLRKEKAVGWGLTLAQWGMMGFIFAGLTGLLVIYPRDRHPKKSYSETQTP
jgi:phosphatidylglycerol---prolipoprotein diacylglyceryl transferase